MKTRDMEVILGIAILAAIAILFLGVVWLTDRSGLGIYELDLIFNDVYGLGKGNPVTIFGAKVGKVSVIETRQDQVLVRIALKEVDRIPVDSQFVLRSGGILGGRSIDIIPGRSGRFFPDGGETSGIVEKGLESIGVAIMDADSLIKASISDILSDQNLAKINNILSQIDSTTRLLKETVDQNRRTLPGMLENFDRTSADAREILSRNKDEIQRMMDHMKASTARLDSASLVLNDVSHSVREAAQNMQKVTEKVNQGDGTLGKLLNDDEVYRRLGTVLTQVDSLLSDIQREPKRYFHISIF